MSAARLAELNLRYNNLLEDAHSWESLYLETKEKLEATEQAYATIMDVAKRLAAELAAERAKSAGPGWQRPRKW